MVSHGTIDNQMQKVVKTIKEELIETNFELTQTEKQVDMLMEHMRKMDEILKKGIGLKYYKMKKKIICETDDEFLALVYRMHAGMRSEVEIVLLQVKKMLAVYQQFKCGILLDKCQISENIRKLQFLKKHQMEEYNLKAQQLQFYKSQQRKVERYFSSIVQQTVLFQLQTTFIRDEPLEEANVRNRLQLQQIVKGNLQELDHKVDELESKLETFWDERELAFLENVQKIHNEVFPSMSRYRKLARFFQKHSRYQQDQEDIENYCPAHADLFDNNNFRNCGIDLDYTHLIADQELQAKFQKRKQQILSIEEGNDGYLSDQSSFFDNDD